MIEMTAGTGNKCRIASTVGICAFYGSGRSSKSPSFVLLGLEFRGTTKFFFKVVWRDAVVS